MSTGKGARVSIPESVRKMIHSIHEITAAHEDEIYATLKDCSMDPNETAQRLLSQGLIPYLRFGSWVFVFKAVIF